MKDSERSISEHSMMTYFAEGPELEAKPGDEIFDGVVLERRQIVVVVCSALAGLGLKLPAIAGANATASERKNGLAWESLVEEASPMAEALVRASDPDEEHYLKRLGHMVQRLSRVPAARFAPRQDVASSISLNRFPLMIVQFKLAPGAVIPCHDHRDYNGVLTVVEGAARVRSFEIVGSSRAPPRDDTFEIRQTATEILVPGQSSTLSRTRANIHEVLAGREGSRIVDVFTFFSRQARSAYLDVGERPDPKRDTYRAHWL